MCILCIDMDLTTKFKVVDALMKDESVIFHQHTGSIVDVALTSVIETIEQIRYNLTKIHSILVEHKQKWFHRW